MPINVTGPKIYLVGILVEIKSAEITIKTALLIGQKLSTKRDKNWHPYRVISSPASKISIITGKWLSRDKRHEFCCSMADTFI